MAPRSLVSSIEASLKKAGFSEDVVRSVVDRKERDKLAQGKWTRFTKWCEGEKRDPWQTDELTLSGFVNYLSKENGRQKATVAAYVKLIREVWELTSECIVGSSKITEILIDESGVKNVAKAKYDITYDISPFFTFIREELQDTSKLLDVRLRLILLLKILCLRRTADIAAILWSSVDLIQLSFKQTHTKSQKQDQQITPPIHFEANEEDPRLCLVKAFKDYMEAFKDHVDQNGENLLLMRAVKEDKEISKATIGNLVSKAMEHVGIDTKIYKPHSLRMAAASWMLEKGMAPQNVMKIGGWTSSAVFVKFYHRARNYGVSQLVNKSVVTRKTKDASDPTKEVVDPKERNSRTAEAAEELIKDTIRKAKKGNKKRNREHSDDDFDGSGIDENWTEAEIRRSVRRKK